MGTVSTVGVGLLALALAAGPAAAQSDASAAQDTAAPAPDSVPSGKKKGGGLLGKAKKLAGNKAVQQVAKTMACTMVPGGQAVAGAIDAASSGDVGAAATEAAGAAAGQTCVPDMTGAGPAQGAGMTEAPGLGGMAGAAGMVGGIPGGVAMDAAMIGMGHARPEAGASAYGPADPGALAACLGLSPEELAEMSDPTGGEARQLTDSEVQRQQQLAAKVDMAGYQTCMMQQQGAGMIAAGGLRPSGGAGGGVPAGGKLSEAPGKSVRLPKDLAGDLKKGRVIVRDIDWLAAAAVVSEAGTEGFTAAMRQLAAALAAAGGTWRADIYLDKRYEDAAAAAIGAARLTTVVTAIGAGDLDRPAIAPGRTRKDKRPRLEIVREEE